MFTFIIFEILLFDGRSVSPATQRGTWSDRIEDVISFKVGLSPSKKKIRKMLKNDEKCFLFYLKSFFCSQGI